MQKEAADSGPWYLHFWPWFLVVLLGTVVGTIVLALFLPLVKMIESVSGGV